LKGGAVTDGHSPTVPPSRRTLSGSAIRPSPATDSAPYFTFGGMSPWHDSCSMLEEPLPKDGFVLEVRGEVDVASSGELRERLRAAAATGATRILVDLSDVSFIDSVAMAGIVGAQRRLPPGGRLAIAADHPYVLLMLEAVGLQHVVHVFPTRAEAEAHLDA